MLSQMTTFPSSLKTGETDEREREREEGRERGEKEREYVHRECSFSISLIQLELNIWTFYGAFASCFLLLVLQQAQECRYLFNRVIIVMISVLLIIMLPATRLESWSGDGKHLQRTT